MVGSGIGGLAAAALLAKAGKRVLVLEQHGKLGGCCHTFSEKGFEFDTGTAPASIWGPRFTSGSKVVGGGSATGWGHWGEGRGGGDDRGGNCTQNTRRDPERASPAPAPRYTSAFSA